MRTNWCFYFAYGSNMCTRRLKQRVPSAQSVVAARLPGFTFRFHKRGVDGSGKGDAIYTGGGGDSVWGVVFRILLDDKPALDAAEGLGKGYFEKLVDVFGTDGQRYPAFAYFAQRDHINDALRPYSWYKRFVIDGAYLHELPAEYINAIERMPADEDPNGDRDASNRKIQC